MAKRMSGDSHASANLKRNTGTIRWTPDLDRITESLSAPETVESARAAVKLAEATGHVPALVESLNRAGILLARHGDWKRALRHVDRAIALVAPHPSAELASLYLLRTRFRLGAYGLRESRSVARTAYEAFTIAEAAGDRRIMADALTMASEAWIFIGDTERARRTLPYVAILAEECNDRSIVALAGYVTGRSLMYDHRLDDALDCFQRSFALSEGLDNSVHQGTYLDGIAACLTEAGEYRSADPYFVKASATFERLESSRYRDSSIVGHAASYIARRDVEEGLAMLYPVMGHLRGRSGEQGLAFAYYVAAVGTLALHDLRRAYDYANRALRLSMGLADIRITVESHRLLAAIAERSASSLWSMHTGQCSSNRETAFPQSEPSHAGGAQNVETPAAENTTNGRDDGSIAGYKRMLKRQSRELLMSGLQLSRNNERILELRHKIEPFLERDDDAGRLAAELIELLGPADEATDQQGALGRQFHDLSSQFLKRLSARYPGLTVTELRICTLLRSNLSSKEIARMLSLSPHTVDTHRLQIRRKLGLSRKESLHTHLISFD